MPVVSRILNFSASKHRTLLALLLTAWTFSSLVAQSSSRFRSFMFTESAGASMAIGNTANMTTTGGDLIVGIGYRRSPRLTYMADSIISFNGVPQAVVQQAQQPSGQEDLLAFAFDPVFNLLYGDRWSIYATGGAGLSFKRVVFLRPSGSCSDAYGCNTPTESESSLQPAIDGGAGAAFRLHPGGIFELFQDTRYVEMWTPRGQFPGFNTAGTGLVLLTFGFRL